MEHGMISAWLRSRRAIGLKQVCSLNFLSSPWNPLCQKKSKKKLRSGGIYTPVQLATGSAFGPGLSRGGTSAIIELQIVKFWNAIALDEGMYPHSAILEQVRKALEFHPFSDR
jgi:hypothetical protein